MRDTRDYAPKHRAHRRFLTTRISAIVVGLTLSAASIWSAGAASAGTERPMIVQAINWIEVVGGSPSVVWCETTPRPAGGWITRVETQGTLTPTSGATNVVDLYGWQVNEAAQPEPVNATSWVRTGAAEHPQDRRVTWCNVRPDGGVQVQTRDGSNFLITGLTVG